MQILRALFRFLYIHLYCHRRFYLFRMQNALIFCAFLPLTALLCSNLTTQAYTVDLINILRTKYYIHKTKALVAV